MQLMRVDPQNCSCFCHVISITQCSTSDLERIRDMNFLNEQSKKLPDKTIKNLFADKHHIYAHSTSINNILIYKVNATIKK